MVDCDFAEWWNLVRSVVLFRKERVVVCFYLGTSCQ